MEENLKEKLFNKKSIGWAKSTDAEIQNIYSFCEGYINFLNNCKKRKTCRN